MWYILALLLCIAIQLGATVPVAQLTKKTSPTQQNHGTISQQPQRQLILAPAHPHLQKEQLERDFARNLPSSTLAKECYKNNKKQRKLTIKSSEPKRPFWASTTLSDMTYAQLVKRKNELILAGDYLMALKYIEHIFKKAQHAEQLVYIMLEWAELLMHTEDYKKAEALFRDFIKLYPGNEYAELAFVKAIESSWFQTSSCERDQSKTEDTLQLIDDFNARKAIYSQDAINRVQEIQLMCYNKLAQSNICVAKHYIGLKRYNAAHKRVNEVRTEDLTRAPHIEPQLLQLEIELATAEQKNDLKDKKLLELQTKFPNHAITLALTTPHNNWFAGV